MSSSAAVNPDEEEEARKAQEQAEKASFMADLEAFMALAANAEKPFEERLPVRTIADLEALGLPGRCADTMHGLAGRAEPESAVVTVFLALLAGHFADRTDFAKTAALFRRAADKLPAPLAGRIETNRRQQLFD